MATWTQADIDKLKLAIATGATTVSYSGPPARSITYRSLAEMQSLLAQMTQSVAGGPSYRLASTRKGL
jgi:hypothetical protein